MDILHIHRFPNGLKAFFADNDRKRHVIVRTHETLELGIRFERLILKEMKIGYDAWLKRYAS